MKLAAKLFPAIALAGALAAATPALADTITLDSSDIGQSFSLNYNGYSDGTTVSGLTATTTFTLTGISGNQYSFDYLVANTTSNPLDSRVSSFGFNTNPDITGATSTGTFAYTTLNSSYPNGIGAIDVCFKDAATGSCSGGGSGGLLDGTSGSGAFTLSFAQPVTSLSLGSFYVRYQSISGAGNINSASGDGTISSSTSSGGTTTSSGGTQVPEPGMLGIMGLGLLGLGASRRLRRRKAA